MATKRVTRQSKARAELEKTQVEEREILSEEEGAVGGNAEETNGKDLDLTKKTQGASLSDIEKLMTRMGENQERQLANQLKQLAIHLDTKQSENFKQLEKYVETKMEEKIKHIDDELETISIRQEKGEEEREELFVLVQSQGEKVHELTAQGEKETREIAKVIREVQNDITGLAVEQNSMKRDTRACSEIINEIVDKVNETTSKLDAQELNRGDQLVVKTLKPYLRNFQKDDENPMQFINDINRLVDSRPEMKTWDNLFPLLDKALKSVDYWWVVVKDTINDVDDFAKKFKLKFFNRNIQREYMAKLRSEKYETGKGSMSQFFLKHLAILRNLDKPMSDDEIIQLIIELFPENITQSIILRGLSDIDEIVQVLQSIDNVTGKSDGKSAPKKRLGVESNSNSTNKGEQPIMGAQNDQGRAPRYTGNNENRYNMGNNFNPYQGSPRFRNQGAFGGSNQGNNVNHYQGPPRFQNQYRQNQGNVGGPNPGNYRRDNLNQGQVGGPSQGNYRRENPNQGRGQERVNRPN